MHLSYRLCACSEVLDGNDLLAPVSVSYFELGTGGVDLSNDTWGGWRRLSETHEAVGGI